MLQLEAISFNKILIQRTQFTPEVPVMFPLLNMYMYSNNISINQNEKFPHFIYECL